MNLSSKPTASQVNDTLFTLKPLSLVSLNSVLLKNFSEKNNSDAQKLIDYLQTLKSLDKHFFFSVEND